MNNDIKEILDKMKDYSGECHSIIAYSLCGYKKKISSDFRMCMNDVDKILDCITNLQEENKKWQNQLIEMTNIAVKNQNKINKAREMIRFIAYNSERPLTITELNKVYNILGGDENE